jgi:alcohol dehydrogenase
MRPVCMTGHLVCYLVYLSVAKSLCLIVSRVVESVGEGVEDIKAGDHVVPIFTGECSDCTNCKSQKTNLCNVFRVNAFKSTMVGDGKTRFSTVGPTGGERVPVYHFLNTSTFSEYTVLDSACVVKINPEAPLEKMCLLSCGILTGTYFAFCTLHHELINCHA